MYDSDSSNAEVLAEVLKKMRTGAKIAPSEFRDFVKARTTAQTTGLKVRERIAQPPARRLALDVLSRPSVFKPTLRPH